MSEVLTKVMNMRDQRLYFYVKAPEEAVRLAFLQGTRGDFNTWNYDKIATPPIEQGQQFVFCGDWAARRVSSEEG